MSAAYEPGTVAVATVRGVKGVRVFRYKDVYGRVERWDSDVPVDDAVAHPDETVTDIRPLMVLDLPVEAYRIIVHLRTCRDCRVLEGWCGDLADQIEAQTKPPKPSEPRGIGAVVEDSSHVRWVRVSNTPGTFPWLRDGHGVRGWSEIDAVTVLSEGVQS